MEKRYNEELEQLIETALTDGVLTDKKKQVLFKKAESFGIDLDEFEMVLEARLYKMKQNNNVTESQNEVTPQQEEKPLANDKTTKEKIKESAKYATDKVAEKVADKFASGGEDIVGNATKTITKGAAGVVAKAGMGLGVKILIGIIIVSVISGLSFFGVKFIKKVNELTILDTPNVVEKIRKISELNTYTYIDQVVVKDEKVTMEKNNEVSKRAAKLFGSEAADSVAVNHEIVLLVTGKVRAGYDLSKMKEQHISISNDTIRLQLPPTEFLDVISNPSDIIIYHTEGNWSHEETQNLEVEGRKRIEQNAIDRDILGRAEKAGKEKVEGLFKSFGFNVVEIQ